MIAKDTLTPTPWAVICCFHGQVFMTGKEYSRQLSLPDSRWTCPICDRVCTWDDDNSAKYSHLGGSEQLTPNLEKLAQSWKKNHDFASEKSG